MAYSYSFRQSPNYTPGSQTRSVWGRDRNITNIAIHHWGDPATNPTFEGVINYLCRAGGNSSAHYVVEAGRVCQLVNEADNAWATNSANPYTIALECNPQAREADYQTIGELVADIWKRLGNKGLIRHKDIVSTACPGRYSDNLQHIVNIANAKLAPPPPPPPATANITKTVFLEGVRPFVCNKQPTNLWNFNQTTWGGFVTPVKQFAQGEVINIYGYAVNHNLNATYFLTEYSYKNNIMNGINEVDLTLVAPPAPAPAPTPPPAPEQPEWVKNSLNYEAPVILYANKDDVRLIDITTGQPDESVAAYPLGKVFDAITRETTVGSQKYYISKYSADRSIWKGFKIEDLSPTAPAPPEPPADDPTPPEVVGTDRIGAIEAELGRLGSIIKRILDFIKQIFNRDI